MGMDFRSILSSPLMYKAFVKLIGGDMRASYVKNHIRPCKGMRILDIGCGPGDILELLPEVEYIGFDMNEKYIESAIKRYSGRGEFFCERVSRNAFDSDKKFDVIMANGVLHHLQDEEVMQLFELAEALILPEGRLVTLDGCYVQRQSWIKRYILSKDRGRYVRNKEKYIDLASEVFTQINDYIYDNLIRLPYTHIIMECSL